MKALLTFSAELRVAFQAGSSPSEGFFYLSRIKVADQDDGWLTSSFLVPGGNACFYEEAVEISWSEDVSGDEYELSLAATELGVEVSEADHPQICAILQRAAELDCAELEELFQVEVVFQTDGDATTDLLTKQQLISVQEAYLEICDEERWSEFGYD